MREEIRERLKHRNGSTVGAAQRDVEYLLTQLDKAEALLKRCEPVLKDFVTQSGLSDEIVEYFTEAYDEKK